MRVLTTVPLDTGLNNQKICLVGLFSLAETAGACAMPRPTLIDYRPSQRRPVREVPFGALFDEPAVREAAGGLWVDGHEAGAEPLTMADCFAAGNSALARSGPCGLPARLMAALQPAGPLAATAGRLGEWLRMRSGGAWAAVQLRIERDWVEYLRRKAATRPDPASAAMTDPARILDKASRTFFLRGTTTLYGCCDESDLSHELAELKGLAEERGFDLVFKSEAPVVLPAETIAKAAIDFALCRTAPVYIGLDRSTFSNMLLRLRDWEAGTQRHYRYNSDHVGLRLRTEPQRVTSG